MSVRAATIGIDRPSRATAMSTSCGAAAVCVELRWVLPPVNSVIAPLHVETARLRAEPLGLAHRDGLLTMLADPRVGATLGGIATPDQVDSQLAAMAAHWAQHGFGWYAWLEGKTGALVARGGPKHAHVAGRDEVEIGWTVMPDRWNQGYATELGAASLVIAFGPLGLTDVVSFTLPQNWASRRVMEKLGFAYQRQADYKGWPHVLYRKHAGP